MFIYRKHIIGVYRYIKQKNNLNSMVKYKSVSNEK